jgi:hypothetical protein
LDLFLLKRAGQAVLQYQEYKAKGTDAAIESRQNYVNGALGGFVEKPYNAVINNINGLSEPFRAGEKSLFGTGYIPELPRSTIGDKSAYWQQNRYGVSLNQMGEGATTLQVGIMTGKPLFNSRVGALLGVQVGAYNIGVGAGGTLGVASAPFSTGGRALSNDALALPNMARNTVNNLDEIFRPPTNPPLAPAGNVPNEFAFGNRRIFSADEPTIPNKLGGKTIVEPQKGGNVLEIRGDYRINVRRGNGKTGTGMEYAWRRHGGTGTSNKSQFSISRQEAEALLQGKDVIKSPAIKDASSGNYIREVDVKKVVGNLAIDKGGQPTTIITVITDDAGNLINVFPGRQGFKAK